MKSTGVWYLIIVKKGKNLLLKFFEPYFMRCSVVNSELSICS